MQFRKAEVGETAAIAAMWHKGWHEGHAAHVPGDLVATRTIEEFRTRTAGYIAQTTVLEVDGQIAGFHMLDGDELYQFYVATDFRGSGVAAALMRHVEDALGGRQAWLACAVGNARAAAFYEKCGWRQAATEEYLVETADGPKAVSCWRYVKDLPPAA